MEAWRYLWNLIYASPCCTTSWCSRWCWRSTRWPPMLCFRFIASTCRTGPSGGQRPQPLLLQGWADHPKVEPSRQLPCRKFQNLSKWRGNIWLLLMNIDQGFSTGGITFATKCSILLLYDSFNLFFGGTSKVENLCFRWQDIYRV